MEIEIKIKESKEDRRKSSSSSEKDTPMNVEIDDLPE